jgi:bifunctional DNA-binding transcriptional regulator/antitoxin component of YhaV-PrlF toxin-antitoxin module
MGKTVRHMDTTLSTKGQLVVPRLARQKLALRAGAKLMCTISKGSLVFTPRVPARGRTRLVRDADSGLMITRGSDPAFVVTSEQVRAALAGFP